MHAHVFEPKREVKVTDRVVRATANGVTADPEDQIHTALAHPRASPPSSLHPPHKPDALRLALLRAPAPMHPAYSKIAEHVVQYRHLLAPLLYSILGAVANVHTPTQHSLLITGLAWLVVWLPAVFWVGLYSNSSVENRRTCWVAGGLLGLAAVCERAACDRQGVWVTKVSRGGCYEGIFACCCDLTL
jgi:hypothetical protein